MRTTELSGLEAVVFDLYNTLCSNPRASWVETFTQICQAEGLQIDPVDLYDHWKTLELSTRVDRVNLDDLALTRTFIPYREVWEDCFRQVFRDFQFEADPATAAGLCVDSMSKRSLFLETEDVLDALRSKYKIGLLSNADESFFRPFLVSSKLLFDVAFSSENVGAYKPHPKGFIAIAEELKLAPQQILFVGDTLRDDILGAQRVGMMTAHVVQEPVTYTEEFVVPDLKIENVRDLLDVLPAT